MKRNEKIIIRELMLVVREGIEALEANIERKRNRIRDYESAVQARDETIRTQDAEIERLKYDAEMVRLAQKHQIDVRYDNDNQYLVATRVPFGFKVRIGRGEYGEAFRAAVKDHGDAD